MELLNDQLLPMRRLGGAQSVPGSLQLWAMAWIRTGGGVGEAGGAESRMSGLVSGPHGSCPCRRYGPICGVGRLRTRGLKSPEQKSRPRAPQLRAQAWSVVEERWAAVRPGTARRRVASEGLITGETLPGGGALPRLGSTLTWAHPGDSEGEGTGTGLEEPAAW